MQAQEQQQAGQDGQEQAAARQQAAFPPPPPYSQLFRGVGEKGTASEVNGGSAELAPPPLPPPPLPAPDATFQMFGELHTTQPGIPPLGVRQMYEVAADGGIDFRSELRRLNRELLFAFTDMLGVVAQRPSQSARSVELVGILVRNLQHLLNLLRPYQAAATLEHLMQRELEEQQEAVEDLRRRRTEAQQLVRDTAAALAEVGGGSDARDTAPMEAEAAS